MPVNCGLYLILSLSLGVLDQLQPPDEHGCAGPRARPGRSQLLGGSSSVSAKNAKTAGGDQSDMGGGERWYRESGPGARQTGARTRGVPPTRGGDGGHAGEVGGGGGRRCATVASADPNRGLVTRCLRFLFRRHIGCCHLACLIRRYRTRVPEGSGGSRIQGTGQGCQSVRAHRFLSENVASTCRTGAEPPAGGSRAAGGVTTRARKAQALVVTPPAGAAGR